MNVKKLNQEAAASSHSSHIEQWRFARDTTVSVGLSAIRSTFLLNGAAAVAVLSLLANLAQAGKPISDFFPVLLALAFGVGFSTAAICAGYFASWLWTNSLADQDVDFTHPYVHESSLSKKLLRRSTICVSFASLFAFGSIVSFIAAVYYFWTATNSL